MSAIALPRAVDSVLAVLRSDGGWLSMAEIADLAGVPHVSVGARLRDLRKPQYGSHGVAMRRQGGRYEYRLTAQPAQPRTRSAAIRMREIRDLLDELDSGEHATTGRDFGRGVAHATRLIREALTKEAP